MNEMSNGSLSVRWGIAAALFGGFAATMTGCPGPAPMTGTGGSGGGSSTSDTSSSSTSASSSSTSTSSSSTSSSSTSSSSGAMPCTAPSDCPPPTKACKVATCTEGVCGLDYADAGKACTENGGKLCDGVGQCVLCLTGDDCPLAQSACEVPTCTAGACAVQPAAPKTACNDNDGKLCDSTGHCVACLSSDDCVNPMTNLCAGSLYTAPPTCESGKCVDGIVTDCSLTKQVCKLAGCGACTSNTDCGLPTAGTCKVPKCDVNLGTCEPGNAPPGTGCITANGDGVCSDNGTCLTGKFVFVTSTPFGSNFGGTAAADVKCQGIATNAGLAGTWKSWTSDLATPSPAQRFMKSSGPYRRLDGTPVASSWTALTSGVLAQAIDMDENHATLANASQVFVWTGTGIDGNYAFASCANWLGATNTTGGGIVGVAGATNNTWTNAGAKPCDGNPIARLYCFQQ